MFAVFCETGTLMMAHEVIQMKTLGLVARNLGV